MKLNCEPGKMAIFVRALVPENQGKTLTTIRIATDADVNPRYRIPLNDPLWVVDTFLKNVKGEIVNYTYDSQLRKISGDNPGNEHWVTEARNKLKGKTEITERGELQS